MVQHGEQKVGQIVKCCSCIKRREDSMFYELLALCVIYPIGQ